MIQTRPVARIDLGGVRNPLKVDLLDPKSELFGTSPPYPPIKTPFLVHFVPKSGPFGKFGGCIAPPRTPPGYGPVPNYTKFWAFWLKGVNYFWHTMDAISDEVSAAKKELFDAKLLIERLPSFSVPKITVVRHV